MPEEDAEDVVRAGGDTGVSSSTKASPGRQLGRRGRVVGGRAGPVGGRATVPHPSRVYNASVPTQRRPDDSSSTYLLLDTADRCPSSTVQRHQQADEPASTTHTNDDQRSLLQNGFVRDRERIYHDNSVIV